MMVKSSRDEGSSSSPPSFYSPKPPKRKNFDMSKLDLLAKLAVEVWEQQQQQLPPLHEEYLEEMELEETVQQQPPPLPEEYKRAIEEMAREKNARAGEAVIVIQKFLYKTDVSRSHNRMSIPFTNIVTSDFLTEEEKLLLQGCNGNQTNKKYYMEIPLLDSSMKADMAKFSRWDMLKKNKPSATSSMYVINGRNWKNIVLRNNLTSGMLVQLWCFRLNQDLCFALVCL